MQKRLFQEINKRICRIKAILQQRKYLLIFLFAAVGYVLLSLYLIDYFFVGITNYFSYEQHWYVIFNIILTIIVSVLLGINIAASIHRFTELKNVSSTATVSIFGSVFSFLGIGCPSCSLSIASSLVPSFGSFFVLGALPLKGLEIQMVSVVVLFVSLYFVTRENTCKIQ